MADDGDRDEQTGVMPRYPSLGVVRAELDARLHDQERNAAAFDTRAGIILALGGVLIGLAPTEMTGWHLVGKIAAAVAAGLAAWSMRLMVGADIDPLQLRNRALMMDPQDAKLEVLDTRIYLFGLDEERFRSKVKKMKWAVYAIAVAVALMLIGSIVTYNQPGGDHDPRHPGDVSTTAAPDP